MNVDDLFEKYDVNGEPIYFMDKNCTQPFSGYIEDYDRGFLCTEGEVINGFLDGVCKEYFFMSNCLEGIGYMKHNLKNGLWISFYESGMVESISLVFDNTFFDIYKYNEFGKLDKVTLWTQEKKSFLSNEKYFKIIQELREEFKLEEINEEILRDGINFNYEKNFRK